MISCCCNRSTIKLFLFFIIRTSLQAAVGRDVLALSLSTRLESNGFPRFTEQRDSTVIFLRKPYFYYCCGRRKGKSLFSTNDDLQQFGNSLVGIKSVGVDYGTVRTGIAVSRGLSPRPLTILKSSSNATELSLQIVRICESEAAQQLVLGLPLDKNGTETKQAEITREFATTLAITCLEYLGPNFSLWFWDERYTSKFAMARLQSTNHAGVDLSRTWIDADSACILLEDYYKENGQGAERISTLSSDADVASCVKKWEERQALKQAELDAHNKQREISINARSEAMKRVIEREAQMNGTIFTGKKKKKKARKKNKSSGWIIL